MKPVKKITLAALFLALGLVLPFLTGQIQGIGQMLSPMHFPVLLCGLICGWKYGLAVGVILPLLRSVTFGMPPMFPQAFAMAFELGTYGFVSGWLYQKSPWQCVWALYKSLVAAMLAGRLVYGVVMAITMSALGQPYSFAMFMTAAFANSVPGIILQLLLIPGIMIVLNKTGLVRFKQAKTQNAQA